MPDNNDTDDKGERLDPAPRAGHPTLRLRDGYDDTAPELRSEITTMQMLLRQAGFPVDADGFFGPGTDAAVRDFQRNHALDDDGIVGPRTWAALQGEPQPTPAITEFPTTFAPTHPGLLKELATAASYRSSAFAAATRYDLSICVIAGIASRESGWGLMLTPVGPGGTGDATPRAPRPPIRTTPKPSDGRGFGRGLMQIDFDSHAFARTGNWPDAAANIMYGASVLRQNMALLSRSTAFTGVSLLQAALSGYNCGAGNTLKAIQRGLDVDYFTTGRNYGRDTLNRAGWFRMKGWE